MASGLDFGITQRTVSYQSRNTSVVIPWHGKSGVGAADRRSAQKYVRRGISSKGQNSGARCTKA